MPGKITIQEEFVKYTNVPNQPLRDINLSWKAKGLYAYLIGVGPDWVLYKSDLAKRSTDGYDSMIKGWNELEKAGYIQTVTVREKGLFKGYDYIILRSPILENPQSVKPIREKPIREKPVSDNPQLIITSINELPLKDEILYSSTKSDDLGEINDPSSVKPLKEKSPKKEPRIGEFSREESVEIYNHIKSYFLDFYKTQERTEYYFEPKDASKIYGLARKVLFKMNEATPDAIFLAKALWENTNFFIKAAHATGDNFIKGNFNLSTLDSKFNDIYSKLKAGKHGNQPNPNSPDAIRQEARAAFGERTFTKTA